MAGRAVWAPGRSWARYPGRLPPCAADCRVETRVTRQARGRTYAELVLAHGELELCAFPIGGRNNLERGRGERDVLGADPQETTHADHIRENLAVLIEEEVG